MPWPGWRYVYLHTSKRMHFIEDRQQRALLRGFYGPCIRQNVCTSLRTACHRHAGLRRGTCIRQNVCTSLRSVPTVHAAVAVRRLHTSKRMHFIEECCRIHVSFSCGSCIRQNVCTSLRKPVHRHPRKSYRPCIRQNVCTSLRSECDVHVPVVVELAYVKTYALH